MPQEFHVTDVDVFFEADGSVVFYGFAAGCGQNTAKLIVAPTDDAERARLRELRTAMKVTLGTRRPEDEGSSR